MLLERLFLCDAIVDPYDVRVCAMNVNTREEYDSGDGDGCYGLCCYGVVDFFPDRKHGRWSYHLAQF